ncbi:MAG: adenosylcobinamide-GDP ribazoletransferase [Treponema sp.]|nr:adenosylcobinamide-GDP ribazoletransferase [Treponema sp.]
MAFFKSLLASAIVALSMYSKIPVPHIEWNKKNMTYAICFFPVVGIIIAFFEFLLIKFLPLFVDSSFLLSCLILFIPLFVTGGIHVDGFLDTNDAISSYAEKEKRLEILKDPHIGAFAIIHLVMYVLLFCGFSSILNKSAWSWVLCFVLSRILSGLSVITFPCAKKDGSLYAFAKNSDRLTVTVFLIIELSACCTLQIIFAPVAGLVSIAVAFVLFFIYFCMAKRKFGGITGDVAGWFLCNAELWMIISFSVIERLA